MSRAAAHPFGPAQRAAWGKSHVTAPSPLRSPRYWGRIVGTSADYLIVCGLPDGARQPSRTFFYA